MALPLPLPPSDYSLEGSASPIKLRSMEFSSNKAIIHHNALALPLPPSDYSSEGSASPIKLRSMEFSSNKAISHHNALAQLWEEECDQSPNSNSPTTHINSASAAATARASPRFSFNRSTSASMIPPSSSSPSPSRSSPGGSPWSVTRPGHRFSPPPSSLLYHCTTSLQRHDGDILSIALSNGIVYTASDSHRIHVWKNSDCVDHGFLRTPKGGIRAMLAHDDTLFTAHKDHKVRAWTVSVPDRTDRLRYKKLSTLPSKSILSFHRRHRFPNHKDTILCLAYYHVECLLYTGSRDRTVKVWRLTEWRCVDSFVAHEGSVTSILVHQMDGCLFTASSDGSVKIWRRVFGDSSHIQITTLRFQPSPVNALAISQCFLYSASSDGCINFWEKEEMGGRYNHGGFLQGHQLAVLCLAAVDGVVFSGSEDGTVRVWRREEIGGMHACLAVLEGHRGPVRCLAACAVEGATGSTLVCSGSLDRTVKVWKIKMVREKKKKKAVMEVEEDGEKYIEYSVSPVLSPSWVERKLQSHFA